MLTIDCQITTEKITVWIREALATTGFGKVVVAVSGGVDSAVTATLITRAIGKENVSILMMPYGSLDTQGQENAQVLLKTLRIPDEQKSIINIKKTVDSIAKAANVTKDTIRMGNIMARVRMIYLFDFAKKIGALIGGTENRTERYLGYFTRFGDEASDLEPIQSLYKTQVWELARYLHVAEKIIHAVPTAGLWKGQTDEGELGFTYKDADSILHAYFDEKLSTREIVENGISSEIVAKVLARVVKNDFKHTLPLVFH